MALLAIALVGCIGRMWNLDFDDRQHLHPDERHWALTSAAMARAEAPSAHGTLFGPVLDWLDGDRSPANPYRVTNSFVYGPVTLAVGRGAAGWLHDGAVKGDQPAAFVVDVLDGLGVPLLASDGTPRFDDAYQVDLVGRLLGALADTLTVVAVGIAGRRFAGSAVGLCAAAVYAASVMAIQHAHFFGSEPFLGLVAAMLLATALSLDRSAHTGAAIRGGLTVGASTGALVAVKMSGIGLAATVAGALLAVAVVNRRRADLVRLMSAVVAALVAIRVLLPGAFVGLGMRLNRPFLADVRLLREIGGAGSPPSIQWADRVPVLEAGGWLVRSTIGPGAAVAMVLGAIVLWRRRKLVGRFPVALLLGAAPITWALVMRGGIPTGRYLMPVLPIGALLAGYGVVTAWKLRRSATPVLRRATAVLLPVTALAVVLWPIAFVYGVYGHENTRVAASQWIAEHAPVGSTLTSEAWDDALPLGVNGIDSRDYPTVRLDLFGVDTPEKVDTLAEQLTTVDYVVESSPRVWNSVVRLPARYPSTITFFAGLDDGRLGFERVATFTSPPRLGPWRLNSNAVEEAFSVYDHPEVRIWQRVRMLTAGQLRAVLNPQAAAAAVQVLPTEASANGGRLTAAEREANASAPTYDQAFATDGFAGSTVFQLLGWLLVTVLIGLAVWVLALPVLGRLPDAGAGIAPSLGLVLVVAATVAATGIGATLSQALVGKLVVALSVGAAVVVMRRRAMLVDAVSGKGRTILAAAATSVTGGVLALLVRAANPDLWHPYRGGEKPFELTMLTAVLRSRTLPPPDTWFAGGALNYYYGGSLVVGTPARLLRTPPSLAMNLGVGLIGALTAGATFALGAAAWAARGRRVRRLSDGAASPSRRGSMLAGVAAAIGVVLVPNVATVIDAIRHLVTARGGTFDWWAPSRVVPNSPVVTEYPAWSFAFGDLHAHVIGLPVAMTAVVVLFGWIAALGTVDDRRIQPRLLLGAALIGVTLGAVRAVNTWDLPGIAVISLIVAAISVALTWRRRQAWWALGLAAVVAAAGFVLPWLPFTRRFLVSQGGVDSVVDPTPLLSAAKQFGLWALLTFVAIAAVVRRRGDQLSRQRWVAIVVVCSGALGAAVFADRVVLMVAVLLAMGAAAAAAVAATDDDDSLVPVGACACLAVGWAAIAVIETVSISDDLGRMNTVFKGWFQVWWLLAIGGAGVIVWLLRSTWRRIGVGVVAIAAVMILAFVTILVPTRVAERTSSGGWSLNGESFLAAGTHPGAAAPIAAAASDWPLIEWFRREAVGFPTVAEAPGRGYAWTSRIATYAGIPTVIGWPYHESQQRGGDGAEIDRRVTDLTALYTRNDPTAALKVLWRYDVRYIVFGAAEQALIEATPGAVTADLRSLPCTTNVFTHADTYVLAVDQPCVSDELFDTGDDVAVQITN